MTYAPLVPATTTGTMTWIGTDGPTNPWSTWYRVTGDIATSVGHPLVIAHGGPGMNHDYCLAMADMSKSGRAIIHYDQIGNGNSIHLREKAGDGAFWVPSLFVDELTRLVAHLGLKNYSLLGQSWGGFLAQEFAYTKPPGLKTIVLANTAASLSDFVEACNRWRLLLPESVEAALQKHETNKTYDDPEYLAASQVFYDQHVCRMVPNPEEVAKSLRDCQEDPTVYGTMNGPSEFTVVGSLKDWTFKDRLSALTLPVLIVSGRHDEAAPFIQEILKAGLPQAEQRIFEHSAHCPHAEERDAYNEVVGNFLKKHDV